MDNIEHAEVNTGDQSIQLFINVQFLKCIQVQHESMQHIIPLHIYGSYMVVAIWDIQSVVFRFPTIHQINGHYFSCTEQIFSELNNLVPVIMLFANSKVHV